MKPGRGWWVFWFCSSAGLLAIDLFGGHWRWAVLQFSFAGFYLYKLLEAEQ